MAIKRARFFVSNHVQDVGCRGFIISEMMFAGFENGNAINLSDGRVEVRIEGEENKIKSFVEELEIKMIAKYGNPVVRVSETEYSPDLGLHDLMKTSQAHLLTQFDKGIGVMKSMEGHLEGIDKKLDEKFDNLSNKFDGLPKQIANELDSKFDSLPRRIANELNSKFDSLPRRIANELSGKFDSIDSKLDSLPKRMAAELKAVLKG
ncbi:MAG: acylphosphatase [Candidatus Diapherotrites archaeon]|nr:acylphosphatase [Candidatus Diapherotrites archaeon]